MFCSFGFQPDGVRTFAGTVTQPCPECKTGKTPAHHRTPYCNTSGLLLFTTDGDFSNYLTRPYNHIPKTYEVTLKTPVEETEQADYVSRTKQGVILPAEKKAPEQKSAGAQLEFLSPTLCQITLTEGKFHEIRRLFQALGNEVVELKRLSFGNYKLPQDLNPGEFRAIEKVLQ